MEPAGSEIHDGGAPGAAVLARDQRASVRAERLRDAVAAEGDTAPGSVGADEKASERPRGPPIGDKRRAAIRHGAACAAALRGHDDASDASPVARAGNRHAGAFAAREPVAAHAENPAVR